MHLGWPVPPLVAVQTAWWLILQSHKYAPGHETCCKAYTLHSNAMHNWTNSITNERCAHSAHCTADILLLVFFSMREREREREREKIPISIAIPTHDARRSDVSEAWGGRGREHTSRDRTGLTAWVDSLESTQVKSLIKSDSPTHLLINVSSSQLKLYLTWVKKYDSSWVKRQP